MRATLTSQFGIRAQTKAGQGFRDEALPRTFRHAAACLCVRWIQVELLPLALHDTTQYAENRDEADHGRLKARLSPMRGLKQDRTTSVIVRGHAFVQNVRRGHYELGVDALPGMNLAAAFDGLALVI